MRRHQFESKPPPLSQKQRQLWRDLNEFIRLAGGFIVSQPDVSPIRFEAPLDSKLPETLRQAGHRVFDYGIHERLMPIIEVIGPNKTAQHVAPGTVGVWQLELPIS